MKKGDFDRNVFINCPYSPDYREFLWVIVFVLIRLGLVPKIASQYSDSGALRIAKIKDLIETCRHGIHDLSLVIAAAAGDPARMNMPYELGIDLGARWFGMSPLDKKVTLVLEKKGGSLRSALSDLGGSDLRAYSGSIDELINQLRQHFYAFFRKSRQESRPATPPTMTSGTIGSSSSHGCNASPMEKPGHKRKSRPWRFPNSPTKPESGSR